jgi:tetratricopeptide (TPR) repeat protein
MYTLSSLLSGILVYCCVSLLAAAKVDAPAPSPDSLPVRHRTLISAFERRDYSTAERELSALKTAEPDLFKSNNYEYLLGRIAEKRGDWPAAAKSFTLLIKEHNILSEYARWHLALIARSQKDLALEREHIDRLLKEYPDSLLSDQAKRRLAESYFESGQMNAALPLYRANSGGTTATAREATGKTGLAYLKLGQEEAARAVFERLVKGSRDDQALLAAQKLDELDSKSGRTISETDLLSRARIYLFNRDSTLARTAYQRLIDRFPTSRAMPEALYSIGRTYYIEYDYANAIKWFDRAHAESPTSEQGELGYYQAGHAYQNMGRYQEAVDRYKRVMEEYPKSDYLGGAHLNTIDSLRSAGRFEEALDWSRRTQERFSQEVTGTTALFNEAKIHLTKSDYTKALDAFNRLLSKNYFQRAPGSTNREEVRFLRVFCLEKLGRRQEAIDAYLDFPVNRNGYYSNRATLRLQALLNEPGWKETLSNSFKTYSEAAKRHTADGDYETARTLANQALRLTNNEDVKRELTDILRRCYSNLPAYSRFYNFRVEPAGRSVIIAKGQEVKERSRANLANELIFLGLYDEGAPELRAAVSNGSFGAELEDEDDLEATAGNEDLLSDTQDEVVDVSQRRKRRAGGSGSGSTISNNWQYSLAVYLNRGSHAHPAIRYGESTFSIVPADYHLSLLQRDIAELLYPAPYRDDMVAQTRAKGVDPRFMLAIARQESRFNPNAKSQSAARGLFQFISSTAEQIRGELKLNNFNQNDLYLPPVAISFGAQYMSDLFGEFKENPYAVAASYNGGEINVRRWIERGRTTDPDHFVAEIAYVESKDYVYKVMNNYWAYKQLYREDLVSR